MISKQNKKVKVSKPKERHICTHLDIGEEHFEHVRAWVAGVEKHELCLLQMIRGETLLDLKTATIKDVNSCEDVNFYNIKQT